MSQACHFLLKLKYALVFEKRNQPKLLLYHQFFSELTKCSEGAIGTHRSNHEAVGQSKSSVKVTSLP